MDQSFLKELRRKSHVPITSTRPTSSRFPPLQYSENRLIQQRDVSYFRTLDYSTEIKAITAIIKGFGWYEIIFLYEDSDYCHTFASQTTNTLKDNEIRISNKIPISPFIQESELLRKLSKLMNTQTRIVLVHVTPALASRLFNAAKDVGMTTRGFAWLSTSNMSKMLSSMDSNTIDAMEGFLGIRPHLQKKSVIEIFNLIGKIERIVGYWTHEFGLLGDLEIVDSVNNFNSVKDFKKIIWPGDSIIVPFCCDVPKVLRLGGLLKR